MTVIEISDTQAAALRAKAAAHGLSLTAWLEKLADEEAAAPRKPLETGRGMYQPVAKNAQASGRLAHRRPSNRGGTALR